MSEWQSLYYDGNTMTIDDFNEVYVESDEISSLIDRIYITKAGGLDEYLVFAYKGKELVKIIPEDKIVTDVVCCKGYIGTSEGISYKIELSDVPDNYLKSCWKVSVRGIPYYDCEMAEDRAWESVFGEKFI